METNRYPGSTGPNRYEATIEVNLLVRVKMTKMVRAESVEQARSDIVLLANLGAPIGLLSPSRIVSAQVPSYTTKAEQYDPGRSESERIISVHLGDDTFRVVTEEKHHKTIYNGLADFLDHSTSCGMAYPSMTLQGPDEIAEIDSLPRVKRLTEVLALFNTWEAARLAGIQTQRGPKAQSA